MVERSLRMREARGSIPRTSILFSSFAMDAVVEPGNEDAAVEVVAVQILNPLFFLVYSLAFRPDPP